MNNDEDLNKLWDLSEKGLLSELEKEMFVHNIKQNIFSEEKINKAFLIQNCKYKKALNLLNEAEELSKENNYEEMLRTLDEAEYEVFYIESHYDEILNKKTKIIETTNKKTINNYLSSLNLLAEKKDYETYFELKNQALRNFNHNSLASKISDLEKYHGFEENFEENIKVVNKKLNLCKTYFDTKLYSEGIDYLKEALDYLEKQENKQAHNKLKNGVDIFINKYINKHLEFSFEFAEMKDDLAMKSELDYAKQLTNYLENERPDLNKNINRIENLCFKEKSLYFIKEIEAEIKKEKPDHKYLNNAFSTFYRSRDKLTDLAIKAEDIHFINNLDRTARDIRFKLENIV